LQQIDSVNTSLAAKADIDGTPAETFTLNRDYTGTPSSNVLLRLKEATQQMLLLDGMN